MTTMAPLTDKRNVTGRFGSSLNISFQSSTMAQSAIELPIDSSRKTKGIVWMGLGESCD